MTTKELNFITDLISYKPTSCLFRILIVGVSGLLCLFVADQMANDSKLDMPYLSMSFVFLFVSEVNVLFYNLILRYGCKILKEYHITAHVILNIGLCVLLISLVLPVLEAKEIAYNPFVRVSGVFIFIYIVFVIITITHLRLLRMSMEAKQELQEMRQAKTASDYQSLVEQVNPHFLFNNLSVLKSLILYDKDKAVKFTENFTDIYRYVLQCKDKKFMLLSEELDFVNSYIALHQERIGEGLKVAINIEKELLNKSILPMGVQLLVENAIKHNIASKSTPLHINISATNEYITIRNNLNKKDVAYSTHKGLENITKRYKLLSEKPVEITQNETEFIVALPLI